MPLFSLSVEQQIKSAIKNGDFDELKGFGKPLDNSDYFNAPESERMCYHILKNSGFVPEAVKKLKEMEALKAQIKELPTGRKKDKLRKELSLMKSGFAIFKERNL